MGMRAIYDRNEIVSILILLVFYSATKSHSNVNPFLLLVTNNVWKNSNAAMHSFLYMAFESTMHDSYLEVLRSPCVSIII